MSNPGSTEVLRTKPNGPDATPAASTQYRIGDPAPPPLTPFSEAELIEMWGGKTDPVVSILCPTYNHSRFIASALDGFLGQATDFPFEIIVRDDASTDGTADIVRSYAMRYPSVIRTILEPSNTFSKGVSFIPPLAAAAKGKFVALCAGDDYWILSNKLQAQVDFMRRYSGVSMCCTQGVSIIEDRVSGESLTAPGVSNSDKHYEWVSSNTPLPLTWLFRRDGADLSAPELDCITNEDTFLFRQFKEFGPVFCIAMPAAAYRRHADALWSNLSAATKSAHLLNTEMHSSSFFFRTGQVAVGRALALQSARHITAQLENFNPSTRRWVVIYVLLLAAKRLFWWTVRS